MSSGLEPTSGFGKPVNKLAKDKIHWYNNQDRAICDPDNKMCFSGERLGPYSIQVSEACPECVELIVRVFGDISDIRPAR